LIPRKPHHFERAPTYSGDLETSLLTFAEEELGISLYVWQGAAIEAFDRASEQLVQVSLATPNGSGKSAVVIPALVLGWLAVHQHGKVVLTTADGKQLDGQVMPALESFRSKFPRWKFQERAVYTPTGGQFIAFTTDQAGRAEGWHKIDNIEGPLLIIVDEAKTVRDDIFAAIDRCTYNGILLTSSPGRMAGRFYESQVNPALGFARVRVGLKECPHITQDKIDRIVAQHGAESPFTRSTLHGEFMEAESEGRFDRAGLEVLREMAEVGHGQAERGTLDGGQTSGPWAATINSFRPDPAGWLWMSEPPIPDDERDEELLGRSARHSHPRGNAGLQIPSGGPAMRHVYPQ